MASGCKRLDAIHQKITNGISLVYGSDRISSTRRCTDVMLPLQSMGAPPNSLPTHVTVGCQALPGGSFSRPIHPNECPVGILNQVRGWTEPTLKWVSHQVLSTPTCDLGFGLPRGPLNSLGPAAASDDRGWVKLTADAIQVAMFPVGNNLDYDVLGRLLREVPILSWPINRVVNTCARRVVFDSIIARRNQLVAPEYNHGRPNQDNGSRYTKSFNHLSWVCLA